MLDGLDAADRVLLICTPTYYRRFRGHEEPGKGKGVDWEGAVITQELYDARSATTRFIPVLFDAAHETQIPEPVRGQTRYCLTSELAYQDLYDALLDQAGVEPGPVGEIKRRERPRGQPLSYHDDESRPADRAGAPRIAPTKLPSGAEHLLARAVEFAALDTAWAEMGQMVLVKRSPEGWRAVVLTQPLDAASTVALDLADALSQQIAKELEGIRERYRGGERQVAIAALNGILAAPTWPHLHPSLRGRVMRTAALYRLVDDRDIDEAQALARRAREEDAEGDGQALAAHLALRTDGAKAALLLLQEPRSPEARHLKAAILIEARDAEAALAVLTPEGPVQGSGPENTTPATAETWRLRALALLCLGRLADAVEAIEQARALSPDWLAVRSAAAVIDFWRACAPAALALTEQRLWPMPFPLALVRADSGARAHLAAAETAFAEVCEALTEGSDEWGHWSTWRLVALLAAGNRQDKAAGLADRLLAGDGPIHIWPLLWASHYELELDREALKRRLRGVPPDDANFLALRGIEFGMDLADGEAPDVLQELSALEPILDSQGQQDTWRQWQVIALTAADRIEDARAVADQVGNQPLRLRLHLHLGRAQEKSAPGSHMAAADALLAADPGPDVLAEACDAHARAGDWAFVANHADRLLEAVPTPASLQLLAYAAWHQGDYRRCLSALDDHRLVYPDGRLPQDLAALRVRCQRMLGELSQAAREARLLYEAEPSPEYLVELINAQVEGGDRSGMLESLRHLMVIEDADGDLLLQGARVAEQLDRELAVLLWRRAVSMGSTSTQFPAQVALLGSGLGLGDEETAPWFQCMAEHASGGEVGARLLHISELPALLREQREAQGRLSDMLWHGETAVHMLPEGTLAPLPVLFHGIPEHNRVDPDPLLQTPILIRHGARPPHHLKLWSKDQRLILDLTALLTAEGLGLLDIVERSLAPLWLPRHWHILLRGEIERLGPNQPRRVAAHAQLRKLVRSGGILLVEPSNTPEPAEPLCALVGERSAWELARARAMCGRLLTYLPLHGPDIEDWHDVDLPPEWTDLVLGPRALLDGLLVEDLIDADTHGRAQTSFPPEPPCSGGLPGKGGELLATPVILGQLAELDLLMILSHRFRLCMPQADWRRDEQAAQQLERIASLVTPTESLIERVAAGLKSGLYRLLPSSGPPDDEAGPRLKGLGDLLSHPGQLGDLLWVDDRYLNGYPSTGTTQIVGVVEVIDLLQALGKIRPADRYQWLYRLRASNYRFIPLEAGEVLHWLRQARTDSGRVVAPRQLEVVARYWSACLYQGDALRWQADDRHPNGEIAFFVSSHSALCESLTAIWGDRRLNPRRRRQRADWVLDNLYLGIGDIAHLIPASGPEWNMNAVGADLASLIFGVIQLVLNQVRKEPKEDASFTLQEAEGYLRWACERVVAPRLLADPQVQAPTAAHIRGMLAGSFGQQDERLWRLVGSWMLRFLPILPKALRSELHKDQTLMQRLGLTEVTVTEVDGLRLASSDLWLAVEIALRGTGAPPILHEIDGGQALTLRRVPASDTDPPLLELADAKGKALGQHWFEHGEVLSPSRDQRLVALRRNPQWWDGALDGCESVERCLSEISSSELRVDRLKQLATSSAEGHYLALEAEWLHEKRIRLDQCFPPPLAAVLTYVRCPEQDTGSAPLAELCWERMARTIPADRGLVEPLRRIALLACPLPTDVYAQLGDLDPGQAGGLLSDLTATLIDPVGRLHLVDLCLGLAEALPGGLATAQAQIAHMATPRFESEIDLVTALADLAYRAFGSEAEAAGTPPIHRLVAAWAHAGRVSGAILRDGAAPTPLAEQLRAWAPFPQRDLYPVDSEPLWDLAWPWHVHTPELLFVGLGRILARYPEISTRLDLSAIQGRLARLQSGAPDPVTDIHLLADPGLLRDGLGCLWGGDRAAHLAALLDPEAASRFAPEAFSTLIGALISAIEDDPNQTDKWRSLWLTIGGGRLPPEPAARLAAIVGGLDIDALMTTDPLLLTALMDLAVRYGDTDAVAARILRWAEDLDSGLQPTPDFVERFGDGAWQAFVEHLVHWLHGLATRNRNNPDGDFARRLETAIHRSRTLAAHLRGPLTSIARHLPYARHRALRRTLLAARARPSHQPVHAPMAAPSKPNT